LEKALYLIAELGYSKSNAVKIITNKKSLCLLLSSAAAYDNQFFSRKLSTNIFSPKSIKDDDTYDIDALLV
jgi:hypothetical protein